MKMSTTPKSHIKASVANSNPKVPSSRRVTKDRAYHTRRIQRVETRLKYRIFAFIPIFIALIIALKFKKSNMSSNNTLENQVKNDQNTKSEGTEFVNSTLGYLPGPISHSLNVPEGAEVATFGAGCFWGVEHIFRKHFTPSEKGLFDAKVGYSGGYDNATLPTYKQVCTNTTNHAEVLQVSYDPKIVSYSDLVDFFFRIHDPTTVNQQGPDDIGAQYRSVIFSHNDSQLDIAQKIKSKYQKEWFDPVDRSVVTIIEPIKIFWDAEDYHQLYLENNKDGYMCPSHFLRTSPPKKN